GFHRFVLLARLDFQHAERGQVVLDVLKRAEHGLAIVATLASYAARASAVCAPRSPPSNTVSVIVGPTEPPVSLEHEARQTVVAAALRAAGGRARDSRRAWCNRDAGGGAKVAEDVEPAHAGQHHVEHDQPVVARERPVDRSRAVGLDLEREILA